jgi:haloacetate dehalogenase
MQTESQLARATNEVQREYLRTSSRPEHIHAMCEDYRAGASIDLKHDEADLHKKIGCAVVVLWGERGPMGRLYDVLAIWKERGTNVTGKSLPAGHNLHEEVPDQVLAEIKSLFKA